MNEFRDEVIPGLLINKIGMQKAREIIERHYEINELEQRYEKEGMTETDHGGAWIFTFHVDPHVNYKIHTAVDCFKFGNDTGAIVFLGAAVEEELARLCKKLNSEYKKYTSGRKLFNWAQGEKEIMKDESEAQGLSALIHARNYNAHAYRLLRDKTDEMIKIGELNGVLPEDLIPPAIFKELAEYLSRMAGKGVDLTEPKVGWLSTKECALKSTELVINFICRTSKQFPNEKGNVVKGESK